MKNKVCGLLALALLATSLLHPAVLRAQGTAFSYEGQLNTSNGPATGLFDLAFSLYTTNSSGTLVAGPVINRATGVTNGLFSTTIDFGPDVFAGASYWLEIAVQTNGGNGFVTLSPRQSLLPVPYAIFAASAATATTLSGSLPASQITGTVPLTQIPAGVITNGETGVNFIGTFSGNGIGLTNVPVNSLAWMTNYGVVAWGDNDYAEATVPPGVTNVAAVSSGYAHTLALLPNGTVTAWGQNTAGDTTVPAGLGQVVQVAAGGYHSLALLNNGTVVAWGDNTNGQTTIPVNVSNVVAVAAGGYHSLALKSNGTVTGWGDNTDGQITVPAGLTNVTSVAGGYLYSAALKSNGTVVAWGYNYFGQASVPAGLSNVVAIAAGASHMLALKANGTVVAWGDNSAGQTNVPAGLSNVVAVAAGAYHSVALLTNGLVVVWGDNSYGQRNIPVGLSNVVAIASGAMAYDVVVIQRQAISPFAALLTQGNNIFPGNLEIGGTMSAVYFSGGGGGLTELNASQLSSGTVPLAQLPPQVLTNGESGVTLAGTLTGNLLGNATSATSAGVASNVVAGIAITNAFITNSVFAGNGAALTTLNAGNLTSGTVPLAQLNGLTSGQLAAATWQQATNLNGGNAALATNVVSGISITNAFITNSVFAGDGSGLTNISVKAGNIAGTLAATQLPPQLLTNGASGVVLTGTVFGALIGNATSATSATTAGVATNVVSGISITNAFITNSVFAGNGAGLTNLVYANLAGAPVIPSTNGFVTAAITNGLATTTFVTSQGYLTNANGARAAVATNVVSGIGITNAFITNSVFAGNGAGLTNLVYANLTGAPVIPSTNGFVTAAITNGLATTAFVTSQGYLTNANGANAALASNVVSGISITNAFITNSVFAGNGAGLANVSVNAGNILGSLSAAQLPAGVLVNGASGVTLNNATFNTAFGYSTLAGNPGGTKNSAFGYSALFDNTSGTDNSAFGFSALYFNAGGLANSAFGDSALVYNANGSRNSAVGYTALFQNLSGSDNSAFGYAALDNMTNGVDNTAVGSDALFNLNGGTGNLALGANAGSILTNGSANIYLGNPGIASENGIIRIGTPGTQTATYLAGAVTAASFTGDGSRLTNVTLNATNITGTLAAAQLPAVVVTNDAPSLTIGGTNAVAPLTVPPNVPAAALGSVGTGTTPLSIAVAGRYAYEVNYGASTLQVFDVSTPSAPVSLGSVATGSNPTSIAVAGRYAYVATSGANSSLQVFDVSVPSAPVSVGSVGTPDIAISVAVAGRYAYVVIDGGDLLQVFDVSVPSAPVNVGSVATGQNPVSVAVAGRYAYVVNAGDSTVQVFDVSTPSAPVSVGLVGTGAGPQSVAVAGRYAYVVNAGGSTLQVFDVSNPSAPVKVGSAATGTTPLSVAVAGRYAYVGNFNANTLQIFDVSTPSAPVSVGSVGTGSQPYSVAVSGRYAYLVNDGASTLQVFDLGGAYLQQFEAGAMEAGTLQTRDSVAVGNNLNVRGGLTVSASARISGGLSVDNGNLSGDGSGLTNLNFAQIAGPLPAADIGAGSITSTMLAAGSVTSVQLAPGVVTTTNLAAGAVALGDLQTLPGYQTVATFTDPSPIYNMDGGHDFGNAMAPVGSGAILIGATAQNNYTGLAYLIGTNGSLITTFTNPVVATGPAYFGAAVAAVSSNLVLIGAPEQNETAGAAYLFNTNGTLLASYNGQQGQQFFGTAVAALGAGKVAISAPGYANGTGAVLVYDLTGTLLTTITNVTSQDDTGFGDALAVVGTGQLLVGALYANRADGSAGGAAYLFDTSGTLLTAITNPVGGTYTEFGESVTAVGPGLVLIGAPAGGPAQLQSGAAFLYTLGGTLLATFADPNQNYNDGFGISAVAVGANELLIAASGANNNSGQAYLYNTNGTLLATLSDPAAEANDYFGNSLAVIGAGNLLVGANGVNQGSGAVYLISPTGSPYVPGLVSAGVMPGSITSQSIVSGAVGNSQLANSSIFINTGTGLSGGGQVVLGSGITLNNSGVLSVTGDANILATNVAGAVALTDNSTSANTPNTLVVRDGTGSFSAGKITANFNGDGSALTGLNASQLASGTVPLAQLPAAVLTNNATGVTLTNVSLGGTVNYLGSPAANTALGNGALIALTSGQQNTAFGTSALASNTSGGVNTAVGNLALALNKTGLANTAVGDQALNNNASGSYSTAVGVDALAGLANGTGNVALGYTALTILTNGTSNIALGSGAGGNLVNGSSNIYIGNPGTNVETGIVRIGTPGTQSATYLAGTVYANGVALTSDRNAKENFATVDAGAVLAKVTALPVTEWNYKTDSKNVQHIGPMAQDFQAAFGLDGRDDKHISVVDEGGVALAAIQGLNQKVEAKDATIQAQSAEIQNLKQKNDELAARLSQLEAAVQALVTKH